MWSVQVNVLLSNCKQSIMSLSLLVGTTVDVKIVYGWISINVYQIQTAPDGYSKPYPNFVVFRH